MHVMALFRTVRKWIFRPPRVYCNPYSVEVYPGAPRYVELVQAAYWQAVAYLEAAQFAWGHLHTIRRVYIRRGAGVPADGWCQKTSIVLISDVDGVVDMRTAARMWAHALLQFCNIQSKVDRDNIIRKAGLDK